MVLGFVLIEVDFSSSMISLRSPSSTSQTCLLRFVFVKSQFLMFYSPCQVSKSAFQQLSNSAFQKQTCVSHTSFAMVVIYLDQLQMSTVPIEKFLVEPRIDRKRLQNIGFVLKKIFSYHLPQQEGG